MPDNDQQSPLHTREYGSTDHPTVIVVHGGPAAAGSAAPLARGLADIFHVLEPWQRGSSETPLTVQRHITDLHQLIQSRCPNTKPTLIGHSWGAMLLLAYAAAHPESAGPIALIASGTFNTASRDRMKTIIDERTSEDGKQQLAQLADDTDDAQGKLEKQYAIIRSVFSFDPIELPEDPDKPPFDEKAHTETWNDSLKCQEVGLYPATFSAITSPVIMIHGDYDPHPGKMISETLKPFIPQLEYHELKNCGHDPWAERQAKDEFFTILTQWLEKVLK